MEKEIVECDQAKNKDKIRENNNEIYVPNWLVEVLAWISRVEMANSELSTVSRTFHALCWPKLRDNLKRYLKDPHFVNELQFNVAQGNTMSIAMLACTRTSTRMKAVPIFNSSMPDYLLDLVDFHEIKLRYLDGEILALIERFVQRCGTIELNFNFDFRQELSPNVAEPIQRLRRTVINTATQQIRRLINLLMKNNKTIRLGFLTFDRNLDQMEVFKKLFCSDIDSNNTVEQPVQKVIQLTKDRETEFNEYLKNDFLNATQTANLFIHLDEKHAEFTLENERTGETLQLYHKQDMWGRFLYNYLIRHPSGQEAHWKCEGEKKIMQSRMKANRTHIYMDIVKIGNF